MTKITEVIEAFEKLLPLYKKGDKYDFGYFYNLCRVYLYKFDSDFLYESDIFTKLGYYRHFVNEEGYIIIKKDPIKERYLFLKQQIPELKKLLEQGYTHI